MPDNPKSRFRRFQIEFQTRLGRDVANLKLRLDVADDGLDEVVVDAVVVERLVVGRQDPVFVFGHPDGLEVRLVGARAAVNHGFEDSPIKIKSNDRDVQKGSFDQTIRSKTKAGFYSRAF